MDIRETKNLKISPPTSLLQETHHMEQKIQHFGILKHYKYTFIIEAQAFFNVSGSDNSNNRAASPSLKAIA